MEKELQQDVQRLRFQLYRFTLNPQLPSQFVKFVVCKTPQASGSLSNFSYSSFEIHRLSPALEFLRIPSGHAAGDGADCRPTATGKRNYFATNQSAEHANCARDPQARSKAGNGSFFGVLRTNDAGTLTVTRQVAGSISPVCGPNPLPPATANSTTTF